MEEQKKYDIYVGYDDCCQEDNYPNPETDWFVKIIIPKQKTWVDTQVLADGIRVLIEKMLEDNEIPVPNEVSRE